MKTRSQTKSTNTETSGPVEYFTIVPYSVSVTAMLRKSTSSRPLKPLYATLFSTCVVIFFEKIN